MKFLVLLSLVALCYARHTSPTKHIVPQPSKSEYIPSYQPEYQPLNPSYQYQPQYPYYYGQWFKQIPASNQYYQYVQQYQQFYQQGVWPIIPQIYEQLTPSQFSALESFIQKIGYQNVEVFFNWFAGNQFYFTPEQYQTLVSVVQKVGYPYVQEFLQLFAGQKFYLNYQQQYITFTPTFTLEYILQQLQQYTTYPDNQQYYGQQYPKWSQYLKQTPFGKYFNQVPYTQYHPQVPSSQQYYPQYFSQIPSSNQYYKYIQQYQELYQQGVWPIIAQIYEQLTPRQHVALESFIQKLGYQNVEILFNYLVGNQFYFSPEYYQTLVQYIHKVGYPYVEEFLHVFAGEKFFLTYQQEYILFKPTFSLEYILKQLLQYSTVTPFSQYYGQQYPQYFQQKQTPYNEYFYQKSFQPYSKQYQGFQGYYPYQQYQNYQGYQPYQYYQQQYQYPQIAH